MNIFKENLARGMTGKTIFVRWLECRGWRVRDRRNVGNEAPNSEITAPDLFASKGNDSFWAAVKFKGAFAYFRNGQTWQTGIDRWRWEELLRFQNTTEIRVFLLFLHEPGVKAKDTPPGMEPPTGLYGETIPELEKIISQTSGKMGKGGMVYWREPTLTKYATWEGILQRVPCHHSGQTAAGESANHER